ncbi:MAG: molybdenum cofactor biosynthesis protein MoaE, partial [Bacteroidota bacterium]
MIDIQIKKSSLIEKECHDFVADPGAGGSVVFVGTVRNQTKGKVVQRLEFEAYEPMAVKEMQKIADTTMERWNAIKVSFHHRVGVLGIGDIAVIIAVSTPHRKAAFEAC